MHAAPGDAPAWQSHPSGRLVLHVRPHSPAAQDIDDLAARYAEALAAVSNALDVDAEALPSISVYLADLPTDDPRVATDVRDETVGPEPVPPHQLTIWTAYGAEAPESAAEAELAHVLLAHGLGPARPDGRFWDEGLAGYLAARSGRSAYHAEAMAHCRQLLRDGILPPLAELVAESGERVSALASTAASAFAETLIERHGLPRYLDLLRAARTASPDPFSAVYRQPLAIADRDWRRHLEATGDGQEPSLPSTLRRLWPVARPYWRAGLALLACSLVGIAFAIALPLSFRFLIDNILARRPLPQAVPFIGPRGYTIEGGAEQLDALVTLMALLGLLYLLNAAARLGTNMLLAIVGESFALDLRQRMLGVLERLPAVFYAGRSQADISQRIVHDTEAVQQVITRAVVPMFSGGLSILCFAALLLILEPKLALVVLVALPILGLIHGTRRKNRRAAARERVRRMSDLSAGVHEIAAAHVLAKLYRAGPHLIERLIRRLEVHRELNAAFARESAVLGQIGALTLGFTQVAVLLVGAYLIIASEGRDLGPGGLVAFYITLNQLLAPIGQVATASQTVAGASASVERVAGLLGERTEDDHTDGVDLGALAQEIRFEGVSFAHVGGKRVLKGVSLAIPAGSTAAFVGPTGAGKSSILHLLPRLFDPTQGRMLWDGVELRDARLSSLRAQIGLVPQDGLLLSATLYENIRFGLDGVSDEAIHRAARLAQADTFIRDLPRGYDTVVGERGVGLSGGQRQRIALARALLREPSLLVLDEATSALDATTQRAVQEGLRADGPRRTIVKVAHRLETVVDADTIFVLDDGRLVEQGSHAELVARGGLYARLFEDQMGPLQAAGAPAASTPRASLAAYRLARRAPFAELPASALEGLAAALRPRDVAAGTELYHRGDAGDAAYVLARGQVELIRVAGDGRRTVETLEAGATFGITGFLPAGRRLANARATTDALLYVLTGPAWESLMRGAPQISAAPARPDSAALTTLHANGHAANGHAGGVGVR